MDESYLLDAARYIELNPVKAGIVDQADQYPWSSAMFHFAEKEDNLVWKKSRQRSWPDFLQRHRLYKTLHKQHSS